MRSGDISMGGLSVTAQAPIALRTIHTVSLTFGSITVEHKVRVLHCRRFPGAAGCLAWRSSTSRCQAAPRSRSSSTRSCHPRLRSPEPSLKQPRGFGAPVAGARRWPAPSKPLPKQDQRRRFRVWNRRRPGAVSRTDRPRSDKSTPRSAAAALTAIVGPTDVRRNVVQRREHARRRSRDHALTSAGRTGPAGRVRRS